MPTVVELSDPYANFLQTPPHPDESGSCSVCLTLTDGAYATCYPCGHQPRAADAVLAISFSVHMGQLHNALRGYKSGWSSSRRLQAELAAVIWRFLERHERCLASRAAASSFDAVTTVPSSDREREADHPLPRIVGELVRPTADRDERLLKRTDKPVELRTVDAGKYEPTRTLAGENVLLIDDTWTTGANAQSAVLALKNGGARRVAVLVVGRHIRDDYADNAQRLKELPRFSWERCALD
jgi:predicted amidophosphoribosyltransferase